MKKLISALIITLSFSVNAEVKEEKHDCELISELATSVMNARQNGVPIAKVFSVAGDSELVKKMAIEAYKETRWFTEKSKMREVVEFSNLWAMACYELDK